MIQHLATTCYGTIEIEARDADHALEILKDRPLPDNLDEAVFDPAYPEDIEEIWQRRREWDAIRPILAAAPAMLEAITCCPGSRTPTAKPRPSS